MPELPVAETKQSMIEGSVNRLRSAVRDLEQVANKMEDPEPKVPTNTVKGHDNILQLSRFLSVLPETIDAITDRINAYTGRIDSACF